MSVQVQDDQQDTSEAWEGLPAGMVALVMSAVACVLSLVLAHVTTSSDLGVWIPFAALWAAMEVGILAVLTVEAFGNRSFYYGMAFLFFTFGGGIMAITAQEAVGRTSVYGSLSGACFLVMIISYIINAAAQMATDPYVEN